MTHNLKRKLLYSLGCVAICVGNQNCAPGFISETQSYSESSISGGSGSLNDFDAYGETGLRRLTQAEVAGTLSSIFGIAAQDTQLMMLPTDGGGINEFENDYKVQSLDPSSIINYELFSQAYAIEAAQKPQFVTTLAGCTPSSVSDQTCFGKLVTRLGRRMLRRDLETDEVKTYVDALMPYAQSENRFNTAVEMLISSFIQNPEFLYRIEREVSPMNGGAIHQLSDYEIATRIAFFVQGTGPDDLLLDAARDGKLHLPAERAAHASRLLKTNEAKRHFNSFHAQWLGFASKSLPTALTTDLRAESDALFERIAFNDNRPWLDIFTLDETYLTPQLARHYGLTVPSRASWQKYPSDRGGGILSHGSFAVMGAKFGDTSPTLRGYNIFKKIMCGKLGPVPPGVDIDDAPGSPTDCKDKRYGMRDVATCASCHKVMDGIGFGLERIGGFGEWRTTESNLPQCSISGAGDVYGSPFSGPRELGELLKTDGRVSLCAATQLFRFMSGRLENADDKPALEALNTQLRSTKTLSSLIIELVKSPAIMYHQQGRL